MPETAGYTIDELIKLSLDQAGFWVRRKTKRKTRRDPVGFKENLALKLMDDERTCDACREPLMSANEVAEARFNITPEELGAYLKVILEFILALISASSTNDSRMLRAAVFALAIVLPSTLLAQPCSAQARVMETKYDSRYCPAGVCPSAPRLSNDRVDSVAAKHVAYTSTGSTVAFDYREYRIASAPAKAASRPRRFGALQRARRLLLPVRTRSVLNRFRIRRSQ